MSWKFWLILVSNSISCLLDHLNDMSRILDEDIDALVLKLEKVSPALAELIAPSVQDVTMVLQYAKVTGVSATVYFHPLMLGNHHIHLKGGIRFEVVRKNKRADVLAAGGQYV
jgi:translation initiation factor 2-alpha kinase 4